MLILHSFTDSLLYEEDVKEGEGQIQSRRGIYRQSPASVISLPSCSSS